MPPLSRSTGPPGASPAGPWRSLWLWAAPAILLLAGLIVAVRVLGKRRRLAASDVAPLEDEAGER